MTNLGKWVTRHSKTSHRQKTAVLTRQRPRSLVWNETEVVLLFYKTNLIHCTISERYLYYLLKKEEKDRPMWFSGRAFACIEGCGFDPQPRHTTSRKKIVPVAPLLKLSIKKVSAGKYERSARCQLIMWLGGMFLSSACDRSVPVWQHSNFTCLMQVSS